MSGFAFVHSYLKLPGLFHTRVAPTPVSNPHLVIFNSRLATSLGLDTQALDSPLGAAILSGNTVPSDAAPLAQAYAGHQYGHFTTLGDGRAILLGEHVTPTGQRVDIQLKGSGPTPYSRRGDGRAALGPMLREYLISEAMHALGIPTTRSLAVVSTGEPVFREQPLQGAVLTRVAASHVRIGTFEWAAAHEDQAALRALADYTIARHYPEASAAPRPYVALFDAIVHRQAALVAQWQLVGFVHGVLNTDNVSLAGETIDYGPCAFMDRYDPATVFSSIDARGRYAYGNQPRITQWNLTRLAETMLPLFDTDETRAVHLARSILEDFPARFGRYWREGLRAKFGLCTDEAGDDTLMADFLTWMQGTRADFTNTFRMLGSPATVATASASDPEFREWSRRWQARLGRQPQTPAEVRALMQQHSPAIIPRNHKVEEALGAAVQGDLEPFHQLLDAMADPYDDSRVRPGYTDPAPSGGPRYRTFCGT